MNDRPQQLFLVRHGQTALNAEGRLRGLANPPLDEVGIAEARAVADALAAFSIAEVRCSPLDRAVTTARIIAERSGCAMVADPAFNDRDYGPWTGHVRQEVVASFGSVDAAPGVEPSTHVLDRALPAVDRLMRAPAGPVCIVTHDAVIRPILRSIDPDLDQLEVLTGSWNMLTRSGSGPDAGRTWTVVALDRKP
ncbi:histidine phosphatase family protein [Leifsonia aquatica]|uniref:histidine phosphatase family protein n=1 Tax=Leifsonia aquatica TaxID=144185 RepID=UPI0004683019|nr:histidine phosphatase family protein [Leifsonia aquatica]